MGSSSSSSSGIGVFGLLGVAFIVLKLLGVINWSWWWVTSPLWIGPVIVIVVALIYMLIVIIGEIPSKKSKKRKFPKFNLKDKTL